MENRLAVYAGTFDPLTIGHLWMIEQGVELFDRLVVAIGVNPEKRCMFSVEERLEMIRRATSQYTNMQVDVFRNEYLIKYAQSVQARFILRGIRTQADYEFERAMRHLNSDFGPNITTVFLMPPREIAEVSSSMVKGLIGPDGWEEVVRKYVPVAVFEKLREAHCGGST